MSQSGEQPKRTPLYETHLQCGARMVEFGGWGMPVQYSGINGEHLAVRQSVGVFDVSHMGQIAIRGEESLAFLQYLLPGDIAQLPAGKMMYTVLCNEEGGVIDDLLVYCLPEEYWLVVNAARLEADMAWVRGAAGAFKKVDIEDLSGGVGMLAVQGPQAEALMLALAGGIAEHLKYYWSCAAVVAGEEVVLSRSGYTGEDGFEIICDAARTEKIWGALQRGGALPCGLGARDTLRTEMGYCLYGHELSERISPLEAGLSWTLCLGKDGDFIGREALLHRRQEGKYRRLAGLVLRDKGIPRPGYEVYSVEGEKVGEISSGTYSPSLQRGVGLGFVEPDFRKKDTELEIDIRGNRRAAEVIRLPFVPSRVKREER